MVRTSVFIALVLLCSCGGGGHAGDDDACPSPAGVYRFLQHNRAAYGIIEVRDNGTYHMQSFEQDGSGVNVVPVESNGFWERANGCYMVKAWLNDPLVYHLVVFDKAMENAAYTQFSENPARRLPYIESGMIFKM